MPTLLHWRAPVTRLLTAELVSQFGSGMRFVALPLLASTLTENPLTIAALSLAGALPPLLVAMPAGVVVDRLHRGRLMLTSDVTCMVLLVVFTVLLALGQHKMWHLFLLAGFVSVAELVEFVNLNWPHCDGLFWPHRPGLMGVPGGGCGRAGSWWCRFG